MHHYNYILCLLFTLQETCFTKCTPCTIAADQKGKTMDKKKKDAIEEVLDKHLEIAKYV